MNLSPRKLEKIRGVCVCLSVFGGGLPMFRQSCYKHQKHQWAAFSEALQNPLAIMSPSLLRSHSGSSGGTEALSTVMTLTLTGRSQQGSSCTRAPLLLMTARETEERSWEPQWSWQSQCSSDLSGLSEHTHVQTLTRARRSRPAEAVAV